MCICLRPLPLPGNMRPLEQHLCPPSSEMPCRSTPSPLSPGFGLLLHPSALLFPRHGHFSLCGHPTHVEVQSVLRDHLPQLFPCAGSPSVLRPGLPLRHASGWSQTGSHPPHSDQWKLGFICCQPASSFSGPQDVILFWVKPDTAV